MTKCKFKVGDMVIGNDKASKNYSVTRKGFIGKVTEVFEPHRLASLFGALIVDMSIADSEGRTYKVFSNCFDLYNPKKILIMMDENDSRKVIARDLSTNKQAEARCNPKDEFDFGTGAKLALERLCPDKKEEKTEYFSGKVVCTYAASLLYMDNVLTAGKVYTVKDGRMIYDDGTSNEHPYKSFEDIERSWRLFAAFIPFKGEA